MTPGGGGARGLATFCVTRWKRQAVPFSSGTYRSTEHVDDKEVAIGLKQFWGCNNLERSKEANHLKSSLGSFQSCSEQWSLCVR